jgi:phosphate transport system permease protein
MLAIGIATPISLGIALYLTELAPRKLGSILGFFVEMLASIPSIVYGLWGIFVLSPWMRRSLEPLLIRTLGFLPFFSGPPYGVGMLTAGLILALMVTPTLVSICREVFQMVPRSQKEGALALGATRWEMIQVATLKNSRWGIWGAVLLAFGRALGETMAVTLVIGNRSEISASLLAPAQTMASTIANEYAEAGSELHLSALMEIGLLLFLVTLVLNSLAYSILLKKRRPLKRRP